MQPQKKTKYIVVTGGVLSGLGKGIVTSSIGLLLKMQGYSVTSIKMDPYINVDAGTMRPTEHGEVFVTEDGGETDQDIGNYERFLDMAIKKSHSITTGQVYSTVIRKERNLEYDGKCVEVIPHIPVEIQRRIQSVANETKADFVMIEVGGTVGDYQSVLFLEAVREMKRVLNNVVFVHVAYLPIPSNIGEMKTKPAQHSVRFLNSCGIQPDFVIARAARPLDEPRRKKLSLFCNVKDDEVISSHDVSTIYEIPLLFEEQRVTEKILRKFNLKWKRTKQLEEWGKFVHKIKNLEKTVHIGIVGKYFDIGDFTLEDSYVSVIEAIKHASWNNNSKPKIHWIDSKDFEKNPAELKMLDDFDAVIVPGGFGSSGIEGKIMAIKYCRENNIPYLGLCYGFQLAVIEFARNVCGLKDAHTTEVSRNTLNPVIDILPEQKKNLEESNYGATMRLGAYPANLKRGTAVWKLYGKDSVSERHRHRYEVNPDYIPILEKHGFVFSGVSPDRRLMEFGELPMHKYFIGTQAHPEFKSRPLRPSPLFDGLVKAAMRG